MIKPRKIVQIITQGEEGEMEALCDDGTMWTLDGTRWERNELPPIPIVEDTHEPA